MKLILVLAALASFNAFADDSDQKLEQYIGSMDEKAWTRLEKECVEVGLKEASGIDQGDIPHFCAKAFTVRKKLQAKAWVNGKANMLLELLSLIR